MYAAVYPLYEKVSLYQGNHASLYSFLKDFDSKGKVYYLDKPIGCKQKPFSESELIGQLLYSKQQDLSSQVLTEKVVLKKASLIQLLLLVREREKIKQKNLSEIERRLVDSHSNHYKAIISGAMQARGSLERVIADLEKQGRTEQISCWRDTLPLRQELLKALEEYKGSVRRANLFLEEY